MQLGQYNWLPWLPWAVLCVTTSPVSGRDGCPMYGCTDSGGFQVTLDVPYSNASIHWVSDFFLGPIPNADGCVANRVALVCQSNGPGPSDTGLLSVNMDSGTVRWRDPFLRFPALPVLDREGLLWGSDGSNLVKYDVAGKPQFPNIPLQPQLRPLFGLQMIGRDLFLMVSETGSISTWTIYGTHVGEMTLQGSVERSNGTFLPTAPAVIHDNRFYVLTEFVPEMDQPNILGLQRLYAIDVNQTREEEDDSNFGLEVAWYCNFQKESDLQLSSALKYRPRNLRRKLITNLKLAETKPSLIWDYTYTKTVFVSLPSPLLQAKDSTKSAATFWAITDTGSESQMRFHAEKEVTNMAMFQMGDTVQPEIGPIIILPSVYPTLFVSLADGTLSAVETSGHFYHSLDIPGYLRTELKITTKLTIVRRDELSPDILIFGIHVPTPTDEFLSLASDLGAEDLESSNTSFVVAVDTEVWLSDEGSAQSAVMWMVAAPENTVVTGQIVGIPASGGHNKDQLVAFSQVDGRFGKLFSITR